MYIDTQPASLHAQVAAATTMASARKQPRLHPRPPLAPQISKASSSSLRGMEQAIPPSPPSFQAFVKKTPSVNSDKPLPSVPRVSSATDTESTPGTSRTSSIYSRSSGQWAGAPMSWASRDFAMTDMFLQPSIYSLSTPELVVEQSNTKLASTAFLQPRAYEPLLTSPSPSISASSSFAGAAMTAHGDVDAAAFTETSHERRTSALLPPSGIVAHMTPRHIKTVSLDKARAAVVPHKDLLTGSDDTQAPAYKQSQKTYFRTSRSTMGLVDLIMGEMRSPTSPALSADLHKSWLWQDHSGNSLLSPVIAQPTPWTGPNTVKFQFRESKLSDKFFGVNPIDRAAMAPIVRQQQSNARRISLIDRVQIGKEDSSVDEESDDDGWVNSKTDDSVAQIVVYDQKDRGRPRTPRLIDIIEVNQPPVLQSPQLATSTNASLISEAERLAKEHHALLFSQDTNLAGVEHRRPSSGRDVKLAPRPLFFNPRQISKQRMEQYNRARYSIHGHDSLAPTRNSLGPQNNASSNRWHNPSPIANFPLKLSLTPESTRSQSSTESSPATPSHIIPKDYLASSAAAPPPSTRKNHSRFLSALRSPTTSSSRQSEKAKPQSHTVTSDPHTIPTRNAGQPMGTSKGAKHSPKTPFTPPVGAMVVATRAEAEAAFSSPITLERGAVLKSAVKRRSSGRGWPLWTSLSGSASGSHTATVARPVEKESPKEAKSFLGHRHKPSGAGGRNDGATTMSSLSHVRAGKVFNVFHRRAGSDDEPPAIVVTASDNNNPIIPEASFHGPNPVSPRPSSVHSTDSLPPPQFSSSSSSRTTTGTAAAAKIKIDSRFKSISRPINLLDPTNLPPTDPASKPKHDKMLHRPSLFSHVRSLSAIGDSGGGGSGGGGGGNKSARLGLSVRRQSKADKRREELKRSIRLVPGSVVEQGSVDSSNVGVAKGRSGGAHGWL
ncbi:hypothetical protein AAFC00_007049 [Neodothiora populina]|uniref:Uncharacterized protein n=1 Tax=Neodothiora populina TaxID=2781224 RepID=A0ABR3PCB5_9PEZI